MRSAIYAGRVEHRRVGPRAHAFGYRLCLAAFDLDELPELQRNRWFLRFRRERFLEPHTLSLRAAVLSLVERELAFRPRGAITLLTQFESFGTLFNPVSFYLCHEEDGELVALVAEITNTPWNERFRYVLDARAGQRRWRFPKRFHVSPFLPMELEYDWRLELSAETLAIHMLDLEQGRPVFQASLQLVRRPFGGRALASALLLHPAQSLRMHAAIYWQAARLWLKRTPFHAHPAQGGNAGVRNPRTGSP